ncbi:protein of unknown function [Methylorubrum extorquens DM4]|uniref:Uncharacterized protein n=1 Tax=Methylorubrum extorquens (strain DSM 6343 / CIP 106787 / DM4) TaxID=661410 RepID=C7CLU0_METED|nr:protein of unknown function [Methylorubrum extorquens DM4]
MPGRGRRRPGLIGLYPRNQAIARSRVSGFAARAFQGVSPGQHRAERTSKEPMPSAEAGAGD